MPKKTIIIQHNGGQLCNQLLSFINIYAYSLEQGYSCENYSFFEYYQYFNIPIKNRIIYFLFFKLFSFLNFLLPFKIARKIVRFFYNFFVAFIRFFKREQVVYSGNSMPNSGPYCLSPSKETEKQILALENKNIDTIYFDGWLFRNPVGLKKYHNQIRQYFQPRKIYWEKVNSLIFDLRQRYDYLIGVHIRQNVSEDGPPRSSGEKIDFIYKKDMDLVYQTLKNYLLKFKKEPSKTCFLVCSNKKIDTSSFKDLNIVVNDGNLIEDLFVLSKTDTIIGCKSTFGMFASYYGNIPLIMFEKNINWDDYIDKKKYLDHEKINC